MNTIVVGYDGSEHSDRALERAVEIGKSMGAAIRVVSSAKLEGYGHPRSGGAGPVDPGELEEVRETLDKARGVVADSGIEVHFVEGHGDPADVLVSEAKEHGASLLVVGTHGKHLARRVVQGSVSSKVVQHAPCDVLVVR